MKIVQGMQCLYVTNTNLEPDSYYIASMSALHCCLCFGLAIDPAKAQSIIFIVILTDRSLYVVIPFINLTHFFN